MRRPFMFALLGLFVICFMLPVSARAVPGDADGNGVVTMDDARTIARYLAKQILALPNPGDADVTQDGKIDMEDAFVIAKRVTGQTRIVVVSPLNGSPHELRSGGIIRIEVFEKFFPFHITGGTVRVRSTSTGYDSGDQPLTFERNGRSLYYHWNTRGLAPASDYAVAVNLTDSAGASVKSYKSVSGITPQATQSDATVSLTNEVYKPGFLANVVDAYCPAPGMPLEFRRHVPNNSPAYPYLGPLGRGWFHTYDLKLEEYSDGRVALRSRIFQSNANGTYQSSPGDYGILVRNSDGTFQLREKDGLIYRFRSDLYLDYIQDLNGNRISAIYDGSKHLVEIRHSCGKSFYLQYNAAGRISNLTDQANRVTTYEYDPSNLMLVKVTDPAGHVTQYNYVMGALYIAAVHLVCQDPDILDYRLETTTFPDGTLAKNEYDSKARLTRQSGAWEANPVTYSYEEDGTTRVTDAMGGTTTVKVNDLSQPVLVTAPDGAQTSAQYDASANLTQVKDPLSHITKFSYDDAGNVTSVTNPLNQAVQFGYDLGLNKPIWITNPLGKTTAFAYDTHGNLTTTTYPDSSEESFGYDTQGNLKTVSDAAGKTTSYTYNGQGRITALQNALGDTTRFSYDTGGELQKVTDAKGHVVAHTRDALGRLTRRTYPDNSHEDYEYDAAGKVTAFTNRRGEKITFSYDVTGRLEWKAYPSGKKLHYLYDAAGYLATVEQVTDSTTTLETAYERDRLHRLTKVKVPGKVPPETYDVSYAYDAAGNRIFMSYPDGYSLHYAYDAANRLIRISDAGNNTIVAYVYDAAGRRTKKTLGNGTYTTYAYDDLDRLTQLSNYLPGGAVQSRFAYAYNKAGIRTSMTTFEGVHNYTYDNTYQLTRVSYPDGRTVNYDFDEVGNRKSVTDNGVLTSYSCNALDQYLLKGSESFGYDANGNLVTRTLHSDTTTYGWNEDDRLISVDRNGVHIDYRYDYQGRLIGKRIGGLETRFIWDGTDLIAEMNTNGDTEKRHIYGVSIDEIIVTSTNATKYWEQQDGLGSVVGATDNYGMQVNSFSYDVYGKIESDGLASVVNRFTGMRWDPDAGLYYVRSRWYDPTLGRFMSPDPIRRIGEPNLYNYVRNRSTQETDPLGLWWGGDTLDWIGDKLHMNWFGEHRSGGKITGKGEIGNWGVLPTNWIDWHAKWHDLNRYNAESGNGYWGSGGSAVGRLMDILGADATVVLGILAEGLARYRVGILIDLLDPREYGPYIGGLCPTFVQGGYFRGNIEKESKNSLESRISSPWPQALLRSDIPLFGAAAGKQFSHYTLHFGVGRTPDRWNLIEESYKSQTAPADIRDISWMQGDLDLRGNLATWNTGLKNWSHLPWHPPEDPTDLNGVYTLRLTVFGKDGAKAEDKVTVEVGRVIAQCLPGIAISPDKRVVMRFPEQALTHPFRIYTILPLSEVGEETPEPPAGCTFAGPVYRIREPGDQFIKDVSLEFEPTASELNKLKAPNLGICRFDSVQKKWSWLRTTNSEDGKKFATTLTGLPTPKAIYALMSDPGQKRSSPAAAKPAPAKPIGPAAPGVLVDETFEQDMGTFKPRDRIVGAQLKRDNKATPDGSHCLKLTNENFGGNFSATVLDRPFDVREYTNMSFDYRIGHDVKIDFLLKVNGRWYNLGFTNDAVDFRNRDVNIANLGRIGDILADDKWHTANVDLRYLLSQQTRHTIIEEIILADWHVGGYMKLEFGRNPRGAAFFLDNFKLAGPGTAKPNSPDVLSVDDFNAAKTNNALGGNSGSYCNPGTQYVRTSIGDVPPAGNGPKHAAAGRDRALQLSFDMTRAEGYGGYWTSLDKRDLSSYSTLAFGIKCEGDVPPISVGIRNTQGVEGKTLLAPYASLPNDAGWREVRVPLSGLLGLSDFSSPDILFISFSHKMGSGKGSLWLDNIRIDKQMFSRVSDFEALLGGTLLGGGYSTEQNGAASISAGVIADPAVAGAHKNRVCRISYGGTIGRDYGVNGGFSFAGWKCGLNGFDSRHFKTLSMKIKGEKGEETPNFYLYDANRRVCLRAKELPPITREWQEFRLPLDHYAKQGIDLSQLESLEIVFEWAEQSGTIYVDDIRFEN